MLYLESHDNQIKTFLDLRKGFMKGVQLMLRVKRGGLATAGPPCGSFIFLNMGTSLRSWSRPLGGSRPYVKEANKNLKLQYQNYNLDLSS